MRAQKQTPWDNKKAIFLHHLRKKTYTSKFETTAYERVGTHGSFPNGTTEVVVFKDMQ